MCSEINGPYIIRLNNLLLRLLQKLDMVKARETERVNLSEKVQFLNSLAPTHELYKQYIEKQAILKTLEQAFQMQKKHVELATQHEAKCLEVYSER